MVISFFLAALFGFAGLIAGSLVGLTKRLGKPQTNLLISAVVGLLVGAAFGLLFIPILKLTFALVTFLLLLALVAVLISLGVYAVRRREAIR